MNINIQPMEIGHVDEAVEVIGAAMNREESRWAKMTLYFHFASHQQGLNDGRIFFVGMLEGNLAGLVGLHHYTWGPAENVWLSWFAVHPLYQKKGIGDQLLDQAEKVARERGYQKLFVETYDQKGFTRARAYYQARGFTEAGRIERYLPDGSAMVVFRKELS